MDEMYAFGLAGNKFDPLGVIRDCLAARRGKPAAGRADPMRNTLLVLDSLSAFLFWDTVQVLDFSKCSHLRYVSLAVGTKA